MRKTILDIAGRKGPGQSPLVCLTAYTASMAALLDPHCDILLVGDSVAMVVYGEPSTLQADIDMMIRHGRAVQNATKEALVVIDMPFGSYQESKETAFKNAARIMKETGAACVKLEGGAEMAETVAYLTQRAIPVIGHVGLQPQSMNTMGGFKTQGRDDASAQKILDDAKAISDTGAFAIVVEGVAEKLASDITLLVTCPVIGIGASAACDGQILVVDDMLGLTLGKKPKFVKEYAALGNDVTRAVKQYADDVRARRFPTSAHVYGMRDANTPITPPPVNPATTAVTPPAAPQIPAPPATPVQENKPSNLFESVLRATPKRNRDY